MALDDVAVEASVKAHRALEVDQVAGLEESEIGAVEGFLYGRYLICVAVDGYDGEAYAVVGDGLVDAEFVGEGAAQGELEVALLACGGNYCAGGFYNS